MNPISKCSLQSVGFKGLEVKLIYGSHAVGLLYFIGPCTLDPLLKLGLGSEPNTKVDLRWRGSIAWTYDQVVFLGSIIRRFLLLNKPGYQCKGKKRGVFILSRQKIVFSERVFIRMWKTMDFVPSRCNP
jgi:hypothetical protein